MQYNENIIGELIIKKREELGMSREEFAKFAGISKSSVVSYEMGNSSPDTTNAIRLAKVLDINIIEFLSYIKQPDIYDDAYVIRGFELKDGCNISRYCDSMKRTYNIRKNENPDKHICVSDEDKHMLFMMKENRFGKEALVIVSMGDWEDAKLAHHINGKLFDINTGEELKDARIIAQFKRFIRVQ